MSIHAGTNVRIGMIGVLLTMLAIVAKPQQSQTEAGKRRPIILIFSVKGEDLFRAYCASCHGNEGKGAGPVGLVLKTRPSDLTIISRRNHGTFPVKSLQIIICRRRHDLCPREPGNAYLGPIFHRVEWDQDLGEVRMQNLN